MFYWFYRTTHPDGYRNRPIILWLQGGPGYSGTGIGNFLEVGPLDQNLKARNASWVRTANILFVDNPVGVGFSIADQYSVAGDIEAVSHDLITLLKTFMQEHPYFQTNPFYIFGQSYGGKMAAALTYYLHRATEKGEIYCNLKGVGIGNGFVSPGDAIASWPLVMYQMSLIDDVQFHNLTKISKTIESAVEQSHWNVVYHAYMDIMSLIQGYVPGNSFYKLTDVSIPRPERALVYDMDIKEFMNKSVRKKLGLIPDDKLWNKFELDLVTKAILRTGDFVKPVWHLVDDILNSSDVDVIVYSGQFDIICSTAGTLRWMQRLTWPGLEDYNKATKKTILNPDNKVPEMFVKSSGHLKMYWILDAGHVVPADVPDAAMRMLNRILDNKD